MMTPLILVGVLIVVSLAGLAWMYGTAERINECPRCGGAMNPVAAGWVCGNCGIAYRKAK